jgi:mRNA-degrading endonuclease RelE of RelBE toxin-antitoxin system
VGFTVLLHPKAAKELDKLEKQINDRIVARLKDLRDKLQTPGKILKPLGFWSPRIGDYRVIYETDKPEKRVLVLFVGHKKKVYDDFSKLL